MRLVGLAAGSLIAGLSTAAIAVGGGLRRSLPRLDGAVRVEGLHAPATIRRDRWGVPHIEADCLADGYYGLGYVHGQDRPFQLETHRRIACGTLAEVLGERALPIDRISRYMGFRRLAERDLACLDDESRRLLEAYAAGVTAALLSPVVRPIEFALLGHRPAPWVLTDTLAWARFLGWALSFNFQTEYLRYRMLRTVGVDVALALDPSPAKSHPAEVAPGAAGAESPGFSRSDYLDAASLLGLAVRGGASNSWAVAGDRTVTGRPLLANDPHLPPQCPPIWYEAHVSAGETNVAGATTPGAPGVIIGHNDRIAWGVTVSFLDTQDLFAERRHPDGTPRYQNDGCWEDAQVVLEEIRVRGRRDPVVEEVHVTRHGPVISPLLAGEPEPLALQTASDSPSNALRCVVGLNRARDWDEFDAALAGWSIGGLNFTYADVDGRVGLRVAGSVPDRPAWSGVTPAPGWDRRYDWRGCMPDRLLPRVVDPPTGWVVSANNRPGSEADHLLAREWPDGYRAIRIEEMLFAEPLHSAATFARLQLDLVSTAAREITPLLLATAPDRPQDSSALDLLRTWDYAVDGSSGAAALYEVWRTLLLGRLFQPVLGDETAHQLGLGYTDYSNSNHNQIRLASMLVALLGDRPSEWPSAAAPVDWDSALSLSLSEAVDELERRLGTDQAGWRWDRLHTVTFVHPLGIGPLRRVFGIGPIPSGGDAETICQSAPDPDDPITASRSAVSYRFIADVGDWDRCLSVLPTGQSGNPASRHYRDQAALWLAGRHHPMPFSREAVTAATRHTLTLQPSGSGVSE